MSGKQRRESKPKRGAAPKPKAPPLPPTPLSHPAWWLAIAVSAACVVVTLTFKIWDTDFWQHLVVGREIWRLHHVPNEMLWTWPTHGTYDVTPSWLFRALLWPFWQAGGLMGAYVWRWLTTLAAFAFLWAAARRMGARGFVPLVMIAWAALLYRQRSQLRPETLVMVLYAAQLWIHEARRAREPVPARDHTLYLPLIALLWANAHISYWVGLATQAIYWGEAWIESRYPEEGRPKPPLSRLLWIGVASAAVSFANPAGWRALAQPFDYWLYWRHEPIFKMITELDSVYWAANVRNGLRVLVYLWPALVLLRWWRRGFDLAETTLCALFLALALPTQRFIGFLSMVAVPFVARDLDELLRVLPGWRWNRAAWTRAALAAALCVVISIAEWLEPAQTIGFGLRGEWFPIAACDFMQRHDVRGRGFNHFYLGGYLLWRFYPDPDRLPFMDIHQAGTREDRRLYALSSGTDESWKQLDQKYRFDWVMLNRFRTESDRSLDILDADRDFALVFMDDNAAIYLRRTGRMAALADSFAYHVLAGGPGSARRMAEAARDSAQRRAMRAELARLTADSPFHAASLSLEANLCMIEGRPEAAREALRGALAIDPIYPFTNERLASVALTLGLPNEAVAAARAEIALRGHLPELDDFVWRAARLEQELKMRRDEILAITPRTAAWADSIREYEARLGPPPPIVPAKLPEGL